MYEKLHKDERLFFKKYLKQNQILKLPYSVMDREATKSLNSSHAFCVNNHRSL